MLTPAITEILTFVNFEFEIQTTMTNVIVGGGVKQEERFRLNWAKYINRLEEVGLKIDQEARPYFANFRTPRLGADLFLDFIEFQAEFRENLDLICQAKIITQPAWQTIFREADKVSETVMTEPLVTEDVREADLSGMSFIKLASAGSYRALLYHWLRELIMEKKIFRFRNCPECHLYFFDQTRNGNKIYCSVDGCGQLARQRAGLRRHILGQGAEQQITFEFHGPAEKEDEVEAHDEGGAAGQGGEALKAAH